MKPFIRLKVVLCFAIFVSTLPIGSHAFSNAIDTLIPPTNNVYAKTGYRLTITSIKVDKSNSKSAKITYNLTNAGRNPVKLGKGRNIPKQLIFEFDQSLNAEGMSNHANAIATALRNQKMSLRSGQLMMGNKLKVNLNQSNPDLVIVTKEIDDDTQMAETISSENLEGVATSPVVSNEIIEIDSEEIMEEEIVTEISTPKVSQSEVTMPSTIVGNSTDEVEKQKEVVVTKMPPLENTESIILNPTNPTANLPEIKEVEIKEVVEEVSNVVEQKVDNTSSQENMMDEVMQPIETEEETETISEDAPHYEVDLDAVVKDKDFLGEDICADLVMESVKIIKQSKNSVTLEYVVANYGNGSAALFGKSKKDDDNVAIKAHLSKSRKLTRGSIPLKGIFISKGIKNKSGMLLPNDRVTNTMKIDVSKMTKFTPVLVLSLDGFQDVQECDEFNNTVFINLIEVNEVAYAKPSRPKPNAKVLSKVDDQQK